MLGSFYGEAAKLVKCEAIDLMVPANAEIVLECELMATEGWVHDEAPFGEFTGMYGGGLKHNVRAVVKAVTHRKNGIFQYATIGCGHPGTPTTCCSCPRWRPNLFGALKRTPLSTSSKSGPMPRISATSPTRRFGSRGPATPSRR